LICHGESSCSLSEHRRGLSQFREGHDARQNLRDTADFGEKGGRESPSPIVLANAKPFGDDDFPTPFGSGYAGLRIFAW